MSVTIAMPVRNGVATIATAIRSCRQQTYREWTLDVIDDGSSDDTAALVRSFGDDRIRWSSDGRNLGLAARLNQAIDRCETAYFARLDADDIAYPERLERQVAFLEGHQRVDLVGTASLLFDDVGRVVGLAPFRATHAEICARPWSGFYLSHPTWMGRAGWFRRHRYRADMPKAQDQDLLLRAWRESEFACLPEVLTGYRQDRLLIGKQLRTRWHFARALARAGWRQRDPWHAFVAPLGQAAKGLYESLAIGAGLTESARRHRALPVPQAEVERWNALWTELAAGGTG